MTAKYQKFGEMPAGTFFHDGSRTFVKIQTKYASGLPLECFHRLKDEKNSWLPFNAVDLQGSPANCPEWKEFQLGFCIFKKF